MGRSPGVSGSFAPQTHCSGWGEAPKTLACRTGRSRTHAPRPTLSWEMSTRPLECSLALGMVAAAPQLGRGAIPRPLVVGGSSSALIFSPRRNGCEPSAWRVSEDHTGADDARHVLQESGCLAHSGTSTTATSCVIHCWFCVNSKALDTATDKIEVGSRLKSSATTASALRQSARLWPHFEQCEQ